MMKSNLLNLRFLTALFCLLAACSSPRFKTGAAAPTDNPVATHYASQRGAVPRWVQQLPWSRVVSITDFAGAGDDARLAAAQRALAGKGGVIYFPAGTYTFQQDVQLDNGVILRGASPAAGQKATDEAYAPATRFEFPKYRPSMAGSGTPNETAFKLIRLADPGQASNCGVVHIAVNRGSIRLEEGANHQVGRNRLVFGCKLTNTASADPSIPNKDYRQTPNQRFTARHEAAIHAYSAGNLLIANNRISRSGDDNFLVKPYTLVKVQGTGQDFNIKTSKKAYTFIEAPNGVMFDYDNRPGIYANNFGIGTIGNGLPNGTPESHPYGFRKGTIIRDNYIYCSGRSAISFTGDGVYCAFNTIRFPEGLERPTTTGLVASDGSATNDNRAITMRGYRWTAEGNDYLVHSNKALGGVTKINDGEGIMHENHHNSAVVGGKIINNTGNQYICIWRMQVDGLEIKGNRITTSPWAINVLGRERQVKNLTITGNEIGRGSISVTPEQGQNIRIEGNRYTGTGQSVIETTNPAWVKDNLNFTVKQAVVKK